MVSVAFFSALTTACLTGQATTQSPDCERDERLEEASNGLPNTHFVATSCGKNDGTGVVEVRVFRSGKPTQKLSTPYDSPSYTILLDTSIDIDNDGIPDLALATGAGRAGDGMHYWRYNPASYKYISAGEAPFLTRCKKLQSDTFYNLASTSGRLQSVRTKYRFENGRIAPVSAIGFASTTNSNAIRIVKLARDAKGYFSIEQDETRIPADTIDSYMDETCRRPQF